MSTAPCPDPDENNNKLFEAVDEVFSDIGVFHDEDGNEREVEFLNPDVIEKEVAKLRRFLESSPSGTSPHD